METLSTSRENYRIEVKNENDKWFITKMLDTDENIPATGDTKTFAPKLIFLIMII